MTTAISLLGNVEATRDGDGVDIGAPQQRAVLALLVVHGGFVSSEQIVDALWPDNPPDSATKVVQTYVSRLRKVLGEDVIVRRGSSYALVLPEDSIDVHRFEQLVRDGALNEALAVWRGPAIADLRGVPALAGEADRLEDARLVALERRLDADIAAGRQGEVLGELRMLVDQHPLREHLVGQLMRALYAGGRQTEALDVYRRTRVKLDQDLGLAPGPELRALERQILEHHEALPTAPPQPVIPPAPAGGGQGAPRRRVPRSAIVLSVVGIVVAALAGVAAFHAYGGSDPVASPPNTIVRIDSRTSRVAEAVKVGHNPGAIAASGHYIWVVNDSDGTLSRVDTTTKEVETIGRLPQVGIVATDERGFAYVSGFDDALVSQVDPKTLEIVRRYRVASRATGLAVGGGSLWVVDRLVDKVRRIDLATGKTENAIRVGHDPIFATFGYGALWVVNSDSGTVSVVRPGTGKTKTIPVSSRALNITAGESAIWVLDQATGAVTRIDPDTYKVVDQINGATGLLYATAAGGGIWLTSPEAHEVIRIDPHTNRITTHIPIGGWPIGITASGDQIWVAVAGGDRP